MVAATFFNAYGQEYQALLQRAAAFHDQFVAALSAAGNAYAQAEAEAASALGLTGGTAYSPVMGTQASDPAVNAILIMTGSGHRNPFNHVHQQCCQPLLDRFHSPSGR